MDRGLNVVVAAEKSGSVNVEQALSLVKALAAARLGVSRAGLVVFGGGRAAPIIDLTDSTGEVPVAYLAAPLMGRSSDPTEALKESWDMLYSLSDPSSPKTVLLIWSASSRPETRLDVLVESMWDEGVDTRIILVRPSPPRWLSRQRPLMERVYTVKSTTNPIKLLERALGASRGPAIKAAHAGIQG